MTELAQPRPVVLQVNTSGAWKTIVQFDAGDDTGVESVQGAAEALHSVDPATAWRIATTDRLPQVLRYLDRRPDATWVDWNQS